MGRRRKLLAAGSLLLVVAAVAPLVALHTSSADAGPTPDRLTARVARDLLGYGATRVIVLVREGRRAHASTAAAAGVQAPRAGDLFRIGSVSKTFTAVLVLQLVDEGKLRLGDTVGTLLPDVAPDSRITVRELLRHQSELVNYTDYADFLQRAESSSRTRPVDLLRFALRQPRMFDPGDGWMYSNTNYVALGLIVERVTGHSYADELRRRILEPLQLRHAQLPATAKPRGLADPGTNPLVPWAAGALVSNADDVARFYSALLGGRLLSASTLAEMQRTVDVSGQTGRPERDGLGIFTGTLPCGRAWWHTGGILDYSTLALVSADGRRSAVVSMRGAAPPGNEIRAELLCSRLD